MTQQPRHINYKSDFVLRERFRDKARNLVPLPDVDFELRYWVRPHRIFVASRVGNVYTNCLPDGDALLVVFKDHGLCEGRLKRELHLRLDNDLMPDGIQNNYALDHLSVELWQFASDSDGVVESDLLATYTRGPAFTFDDFTPAQLEEFARPATEAAGRVSRLARDFAAAEEERKAAEDRRVRAEDQRAAEFAGFSRDIQDAALYDLIATARAAGAVWNAETRLFSLNTLTDITVDEMRRIIKWGQVNSAYCKGRYCNADIRTNLPFLTGLSGGGGADTGFSCECMFSNCKLEVVWLNNRFRPVQGTSVYAGVFHSNSIRKIIGVVDLLFKPPCFSPSGGFSPFGTALEEVQIRNLQTNLWLGNCPKLRPASVRYAIAQRNDQNNDTTQLRITLHPDVYALVTDPDNAEGMEIMALADEKNVTIATTE